MFMKFSIQAHSLTDKFNIHKNAITLTNYLQAKLSHLARIPKDAWWCWEIVVNHKLSYSEKIISKVRS